MSEENFGIDSAAHDAARAAILDSAAEVFHRRGFARATIEDIADSIGATKGRVYYYFRSKFDIYLDVYAEGMRRVRASVEPLAAGPGDGRARLFAMATAHAENLMGDLKYHNTIHQGLPGHGEQSLKQRQREQLDELNGTRRDYELMFRSVVADGIADGSLRAGDATLAARVLLSSLNAIDTWYHPRVDQSAEWVSAMAEQIADLLIGGMGSRPAQ